MAKKYGDLIGRKLHLLRVTEFMTQEELSKASGVSRVQISNIERGIHMPGKETLNMLAKALNVKVENFFRD